jgi:hypothetical protein
VTTYEALDWMQSNFPNRSACADKSAWYHARNSDEVRPKPSYSISVQPGFNDTPCQLFTGPSFERCIQTIQEATRLEVKGEPNDE